jgi:hypothetical protein
MAKIKSMCERGSPCCNPLLCWMVSPRIPFISTLVEDPKPNYCITSRRNDQEIESNALEMSNLRRIRDFFASAENEQFVVQS